MVTCLDQGAGSCRPTEAAGRDSEARDSEWQWHQLGHMQVCTSLQTDNHASTPPLSFLTGWMPFLPPNQQRQSTEGTLQVELEKRLLNGCLLTSSAMRTVSVEYCGT